MTSAPYTLVLLRHGESEWNAKNLFTGWVDVAAHREGPRRGRAAAATLLAEAGRAPRRACTPRCCAARSPPRTSRWTPPTGTGSRCSGPGGSTSATTARCRARTRRRPSRSTARSSSCSGAARTTSRRRRSPTTTSCRRPATARYADLADEILPRTECLADVVERMLPYWYDAIVPDLRAGRTVLRRGARQLAARAGQAPRRDLRRGHRRAQHPHRHPAGLPARRATCSRPRPAASTSTRTRRPTPSRRSRTRAADPARPGQAEPRRRPTVVDGGDRLAGDQVDDPAGQATRRGRRSARSSGRAGRCRRPARRRAARSRPSSSRNDERRSWSISSSSSSSWRAPSTSRSAMMPGDRADHLLGDRRPSARSSARSSSGTRDLGHPQPGDLRDVHRRGRPSARGRRPSAARRRASAGRRRPAAGGPAARRTAPRPARGRRRCWRRR